MYKLEKDRKNNLFSVVELATGIVMAETTDHDESYNFYRFLKNGGAFSGYTPRFFTISCQHVIRSLTEQLNKGIENEQEALGT